MASAAQRRIKSISYAKYGYIFILPFFLVYFFFQLWPLINTFIVAFQGNGNATGDWVGLDNFKTLLQKVNFTKQDDLIALNRVPSTDEEYEAAKALKVQYAIHNEFVDSFKHTLVLWIGNFIPQILLSLSLAVWFTDAKLKIPGKGFFKVVMYMPNIITAASVAVLFMSLCSEDKYGAFNQLFHSMGIVKEIDGPKADVVHLLGSSGHPWPARIVIMFIQTWMWFGNTMIMLMSGIMGINPSLFEAASIDGASSGQVFRKITLPLLSPIMVYTLVTSMIGGLQMFDIPYLYHKGTSINTDLETVAVFIYRNFHTGQKNQNYGWSGAASVLLFIVTLILGCITFYLNRDTDEIAKKKQRKKLAKQAKIQNKQFGGLSL
jgi:multiple sugar transport system permease protein